MVDKIIAGLDMSLAIHLFCCFLFFYGEVVESKYDEEAAKAYLDKINADLQVQTTQSVLASWAYESNITDENLKIQLDVSAKLANYTKEIWKETLKYPWKTFKDPDVKRQFEKFSVLGSAILSPEKYERYNKIISDMQSTYGKAKICDFNNKTNCTLQLEPELTEIFANCRHPDELRYYWNEWRKAVGRPIRKMFKEYVKLSNEAAALNNFTDAAEAWLKEYESPDFKEQVAVLWEQVKPLYLHLHAYVRRRLREHYGENHVSKRGPIPAHLLGNMWAQSWNNIFNLSAPYPGKPSMDVTPNMIRQGYTPTRMFKLAEEFFTSLGLCPMPDTFWKNSIFEKPNDGRDMICHASAWDFYDGEDFRIKQCTRVTMEDLNTVHHEMGHIQYFLQYKNQPLVYKEGTNPGFHEAVGDVMALSVSTPKHLRKICLLNDTQDDAESDINQLFSMALDKVAFLPFGYLMDQWRWSIFEGKTTEKDFNTKWWELREKYQGLSPPVPRTEDDFDGGAKYHTVGNVPYIRYFVSFIIQFQFHRSLCIAAKEFDPSNPTLKPLHKCDIYQSKEAGGLLQKMLEMGSSRPWPDAMEVMTGQRKMDAGALLDYFATLRCWLEQENKKTGEFIGWEPVPQNATQEGGKTDCSKHPSHSQGSVEDGSIAYAYAELVRQDDNSFEVPDYFEEVKDSYHTRLDPKNNDPRHFSPSKHDYKLFIGKPSDMSQEIESIKSLASKVRLLKELEKQGFWENGNNDKIVMESNYDLCKIPTNSAERKEVTKTKVLQTILKDLHQMRANKGMNMPHSISTEHYKRVVYRESGNEKKPDGPGKEKEEKAEKARDKIKLGDKEKLKNREKLEAEMLVKAREEKCRSVMEELKNAAHRMESVKENEGKPGCILEKARNMKFKTMGMHIPNIELMWEAELVKSEAEQMLKNFNFSKSPYFANISAFNKPSVRSEHFDYWPSPLYNIPTAEMPIKTKKSRNTQSKFGKKYDKLTVKLDWKSLQNSLLNTKRGFLKTSLDDQKYLGDDNFKKFNLVGVFPINNLFGDAPTHEYKSEKSGAREEKGEQYLMLVGKLADKIEEEETGGKRYSKKSYKEFHSNTRTPILYNGVVITAGRREKPNDSKDRWCAIRKKKRNSPGATRHSGFYATRKRRRLGTHHDAGKKYKKRLSRFVKRRKININNILQYFGLTTPFVISFYFS